MAAVVITKPDAASINIANNIAQVVGYVVQKLDSSTNTYTTITGGSGSLAIGADVTISLADGLYKIIITPATDPVENYIKTIFNSLEECYVNLFSEAVNEAIVKESCCDSCSKNRLNLANFQILLQVYFSILKKYENFDSPFATLDSDTLSDLVRLKQVEENLTQYCTLNNCDCGCN